MLLFCSLTGNMQRLLNSLRFIIVWVLTVMILFFMIPGETARSSVEVKNIWYIFETLIHDKGFSDGTHAGIVSRGNRPGKQVVTGNLGNNIEQIINIGIEPPAVFMDGSVVSLREKPKWFDIFPLLGKKIVVTGSRAKALKISHELTRLGAEIIELPSIEIVPVRDMARLNIQ